MPAVSICIPSYNHAEFLPAAIESALGQTFRDFELVIVDDGSTDASLQIARAYERRDPARVRVFTHPGAANRGIAATGNRAVAEARGEFWAGLPSDDILRSDRLERHVPYLRRHPEVDLVYSYGAFIDAQGKRLRHQAVFGIDVSHEKDPAALLIPGNVIPAMAVLARMETYRRFAEDDLALSDWEMWVRIFAACRVGFVPTVVADHRRHGYNTSGQGGVEVDVSRSVEVIEALKAKVPRTPTLQRPLLRTLLDLEHAYLSFCAGETLRAAELLSSALQTDSPLWTQPAQLGYFLARWECDALHPQMAATAYSTLGRRLAGARPEHVRAMRPSDAPANFSFWLLCSHSPRLGEQASDELRRVVGAVQHIAAGWCHRRAGARARAAASFAEAFLTCPRLLAGRTAGSLWSHTVQRMAVGLVEQARVRAETRASPVAFASAQP